MSTKGSTATDGSPMPTVAVVVSNSVVPACLDARSFSAIGYPIANAAATARIAQGHRTREGADAGVTGNGIAIASAGRACVFESVAASTHGATGDTSR